MSTHEIPPNSEVILSTHQEDEQSDPVTFSGLLVWVRNSLGLTKLEQSEEMLCETRRGIRECRRRLSDRG